MSGIGVVSDVHLGYKYSKTSEFIKFLNNYDEKELILLGDIFDLWRKSNADVMLKNEEVFELLLTIPKLTYVIGNHDYAFINYKERYKDYYNLSIKKFHTFTDYNNSFYLDHGYVLDVIGNMEPMHLNDYESFASGMCDAGEVGGYIASSFYSIYESIQDLWHRNTKYYQNITINKLANSRFTMPLLGLKEDDFYIYGHTHEALINTRCANTGCWIEGSPSTYILIEHGRPNLLEV